MTHRTIVLYGHCEEVNPGDSDANLSVAWKDAVNFHDMAAHMLHGEYESAVVIPVNSSHGCGQNAAIRISIDRAQTNFKGFTAHFWLGDSPYTDGQGNGDCNAFDFDWVAYIPCAETLT